MRSSTNCVDARLREVVERACAVRSASISRVSDRAADGLGRVAEPDRRVAVGGADLEHPLGAQRAHEHAEQLGGLGLDVAEALEPVVEALVVGAAVRVELVQEGLAGGVHQARGLVELGDLARGRA